jgi:hypothetical protein
MVGRRSKPLLIAPLIPLWGVLAFLGVETLRGTRYVAAFVVVMLLLLATLFTYVANQTLRAKRARLSSKGVQP